MRCSCVPARAAPRRSTIAVAVSPDGVTAATGVARWRGAGACVRRMSATTIALPKRDGRPTGSRRRTVALGVPGPWGITAATPNQESYEHCPRWRLMPSRRSSMPRPSTQPHRHPSENRATRAKARERRSCWSGCWSRGPRCSAPRGDEQVGRCAALSVGGEGASSRSSPSTSGGIVLDADSARSRDV